MTAIPVVPAKRHPRVLIVGTVPYNEKSTSRAFDAYFHDWENENLAQIFSNAKTPCKGHCATLYQITDQRMLRRWLGYKEDTGVIFRRENLADAWKDSNLEISDSMTKRAYQIGSRHTPLTHILRGLLWRKSFWCTEMLNNWLDEFSPECVFLAFSDDYFILQIALYVADRFGVPIVSCIGDDYYFNLKVTASPLYWVYKMSYRKLVRKVLGWPGSAIYISDKIKRKYNSEFGLNGETVYLASTIPRKAFKPINSTSPLITYFGNIRMGRNRSLVDIGEALGRLDKDYILEVYSNESDEAFATSLRGCPNVRYMGSIPYEQVKKRMTESDVTVIVEGFSKADINAARYSLSTKAADALACGASIFTYGPMESGIVEYMASTNASEVCVDRGRLDDCLRRLLNDVELQRKRYERAVAISETNHTRSVSCRISESVVANAIHKYNTTIRESQ